MIFSSVRFFTLIAVFMSALFLSGCGESSSSSGGDALDTLVSTHEAGESGAQDSSTDDSAETPVQTLDLTSNEPSEPEETSKSESQEPATQAAATASNQKARGPFDLTFKQTYQPCPDCGVWFDSVELVIVHSQGTFTARQGRMHVKQAPNRVGHFVADVSAIPRDAAIIKATLNMLLNRDEGIANADSSSVFSVYGKVDGQSRFVREITARDDIKGKGYSKANPMVPIDITGYAKQL